jgi:predicted membrane-bound spermidine synthase
VIDTLSTEQALARLASDLLSSPVISASRIVAALSVAYTLGALNAMQSEIAAVQRAELGQGELQ